MGIEKYKSDWEPWEKERKILEWHREKEEGVLFNPRVNKFQNVFQNSTFCRRALQPHTYFGNLTLIKKK